MVFISYWQEDPDDVDNDKTEVNDKDSYIKVVFDQSFDQKGSRDIEGNSTDEKKKKTKDFETFAVDDRKEGSKDVDGNNNVDEELPWWIRVVSPSADKEKPKVFQAMEDDEEPEFGVLVVLVDLPAGEEGEGEPEGGDEVHQPLPHHANPKLGWEEKSMAGHQHQVDEEKCSEDQSIGSHLCWDGIKAFAEIFLEFNGKERVG